MKKNILMISFVLMMLLTGCANEPPAKDDGKIQVYTTVYPLQYFTERIAGDIVNVQSMYPPGSDEHTFEPTQKDMMALADADLFFYIGLGLEGFVENAEKTLKNEHVQLIATADAITEDMLMHDEEEAHDGHDHGDMDPHVWMSPVLSDALAYSIKESLINISPENKALFEANFEALRDDLLALDRQFIDMASATEKQTFFVSHAAFGYIADTYGLEQIAVAGLNSQSEPSQKELANLVAYAKDENIQYVLFEQNVSSKLTEIIQKEIGAKSLTLHNLGVLTTEDLNNNEDYFSLMEANLNTLKQALGTN